MSGGGENEATLESTPTWVVAILCTVFVVVSLAAERLIHYTGKYLKKTNKKPLFQALQKIKEELMLMGFISLLLTVFQGRIGTLCISHNLANKWLPCNNQPVLNLQTHLISRHLLAQTSNSANYCQLKGKVPVLSVTALHHLHIFIFVLAVVHVVMCALTVLFGGIKIREWRIWEEVIQKMMDDPEDDVKPLDFVRSHSWAVSNRLIGWVEAFFKQFYGSVTESDYRAMRMGFIMTHCKSNTKFNFHNYMVRAFEADFKKVVGISWFLWLFVIIFLFLNVNGYHAYFWIAFIPLIMLFGVGMKLEHIIIKLAKQVADERHSGHIVIHPSNDYFWFHKPRLLLLLIHIILFQNSFELAFFFWIWVQYGFDSCIMGSIGYTVPRLVITAFVQFICSYSTLPLYAIVTQMGSSFNKAIFEDYIQEHLIEWAHKAKKTRTSLHHLLPSPPRDAAVTKRTLSMPAIRISTVEEGHNSTAREIKSEHHIHTEKENVVETQLTCEGVTKSAEKPVL
ncbi:MLO-like protein 15 [Amaranthus tricolor]|uniref:MLO-like protein 15 n=1 Tax=Amaranthus tricolor TaxID=29722 RepID=UPI00258B27FD|nr:MLO-like protein 15 [Amaranthus tricolor]